MFELNVHVLKFNVQISNVQVREFDLQNIYKQHQTAQLLHATITYLHRQESQIPGDAGILLRKPTKLRTC